MLNSDLLPILKALAHETRLHMLEVLLSKQLCVGALAHNLGISEGAASQHLQVLRKAGLVIGEKHGYWTHYKVQTQRLQEAAEKLSILPQRVLGLRDLNSEVSKSFINQKGGE